MNKTELEAAGKLAEQLSREITKNDGDLGPVYSALEEAAVKFKEGGGQLESVVPGSDGAALGFRRGRPDGRSIWDAYAEVLRDEICKPRGSLHKQVHTGLATGGATLVSLIMTTLGLPVGAIAIVAPIAGSIMGLGVTAFCKHCGPAREAKAPRKEK